MAPAHVVLLLAVTIAVVAIAGYLIAITLILKHVVGRLVTILGAIQAVTETTQPVGAVVDDINRDLAAGRKLIEDGVERLEQSRAPVGASSSPRVPRHPVEDGGGGTATATPPPSDPAAAIKEEPDAPSGGRGRGWWHR